MAHTRRLTDDFINGPFPYDGATVMCITHTSSPTQRFITYLGASVLTITDNATIAHDLAHADAVPAYLNAIYRRSVDDGDSVVLFSTKAGQTLPAAKALGTCRAPRRGQVPYTPVWTNSHWGANIVDLTPKHQSDAAALLEALGGTVRPATETPGSEPPVPSPRGDDSSTAGRAAVAPYRLAKHRSPADYMAWLLQ
jgi:hypothetical protein